jgi:site-specific DNA recombinase
LNIDFRAIMNALFLKDRSDKVRRALRARVEKGKAVGALSYGYGVVRHVDAAGEPIRGDRKIKWDEAEIIRRVLGEFANRVSPRTSARRLNENGIPGPAGGWWRDPTIRGDVRRATGLTNNQLYIGKLVWNRVSYLKDRTTGRRISLFNPPENWLTVEVPELRIVSDELWNAVKARQAELRNKAANDNSHDSTKA